MPLVRPTSRRFSLVLCVLFVGHCFWLPAHLAFEDHCFGGEGARHYHHHPHDHHDDGPGEGDGHHDPSVPSREVARSEASHHDEAHSRELHSGDNGHHHHDPAHHPHPVQVHYQELVTSRLKDTAVAPACPAPEITFVVHLDVTVLVTVPLPAPIFHAPECSSHGPRAPPAA